MKKISNNYIFIPKRILPLLAVVFLLFISTLIFKTGMINQIKATLWLTIIAMIFGYIILKIFVWDLMDEVEDCEKYLIVTLNGEKETISLENIININAETMLTPPRITLRLRSSGKFGNEVPFCPKTKFSLNHFRKNEIAEDLILRVDEARNR